jgi:CRISPR-associated protein Csx17
MGLGLLSACAKRWPDIRGCWREACFNLLHRENNINIEEFILNQWQPTSFESWDRHDSPWIDRSKSAIRDIQIIDSLVGGINKPVYNPTIARGRNVGKRPLSQAYSYSIKKISNRKSADVQIWLKATLYGNVDFEPPEAKAMGTWFPSANRTYNTGQSLKFYREGRISPWSALLALEGSLILTGGVNRKLSSSSRSYAVFPFVSEAASPIREGEIGQQEAEFWAPCWERPMLLSEAQLLFKRGFARIGNRSASQPHEFALAIKTMAIDSDIGNFRRFQLQHTTNSNLYESITGEKIVIGEGDKPGSVDELISPLLPWLERLPYEPRDSKKKGKYVGLRGPIEHDIISVAEYPKDPSRWRSLLLHLADAQKKIDQDRTRDWRKTCIALPKLSINWLNYLWPDQMPDEVRIASSIASLGSKSNSPLLVNIFGVEITANGTTYLPKDRPARAIWSQGPLVDQLIKILTRRLIDTNNEDPWPLEGSYPATGDLVGEFLNEALDDEMITRWLPALSLLDWRKPLTQNKHNGEGVEDGTQLLDGFFRPLLTSGLIWERTERAIEPSSSFALHLVNLLQQDDLENAVELATSQIQALGRITSARPNPSNALGSRHAAALLIPMTHRDVYFNRDRWLQHLEKI